MQDLAAAITDAWSRIRPRLEAEPAELAKRLARRKSLALRRPPREWCFAVRASDRRISGQLSAFSGQPSEAQEIRFDLKLLRELYWPVRIDPAGEPLRAVAKKLGVSVGCLLTSRAKGLFRTQHIQGLGGQRGWAVPILYCDRPLAPGAKLFAGAQEAWLITGWHLMGLKRAEFTQTVTRVPYWREHTVKGEFDEHRHPEVDTRPRRRSPEPRLPPRDLRDLAAAYKWKGDEYIGYDWKAAEKNPRIRINYEKVIRTKEMRLARYRENRAKRKSPSRSSGSLHLNGWLWRCPACGKTCRTIYFPMLRENLLEGLRKLMPVEAIRPLVEGLACAGCHRLQYSGGCEANKWNVIISYLSGGMLYGAEVVRPSWFKPQRQRAYRPQSNRRQSLRRPQVMELLLEGLSYAQIARRLGLSPRTINEYVRLIYRQHDVHSRAELARRLGRGRELERAC